jgi:hypothetical protein
MAVVSKPSASVSEESPAHGSQDAPRGMGTFDHKVVDGSVPTMERTCEQPAPNETADDRHMHPSSPRSGVRPTSSARQSDLIVLRWLPLMINPSLRQDSVFQGSHRRTARAAMSSSRLPLV